eukprot:SAG11_NODE_79_length_17750_cov_28.445980_4_plen_264_part_00
MRHIDIVMALYSKDPNKTVALVIDAIAAGPAALIEEIPILPVQLDYLDQHKQREAGYDFQEQKEYMQNFATELDPTAASELLAVMTSEYPDHKLTLDSLGKRLYDAVPRALSHRYTLDASKRERKAQTDNILDAIAVATSQERRNHMTFWRTARALVKALPRVTRPRWKRVAPLPAASVGGGGGARYLQPDGGVTRAYSSSDPSLARSVSAPSAGAAAQHPQQQESLVSAPVPLKAGGAGKLPPMSKSKAVLGVGMPPTVAVP